MTFDFSLNRSYEYIHYTSENIGTLDLDRKYTQTTGNLVFHTPAGLWLSIAGIYDWEWYCRKNNFRLENLKSEFQVFLKPKAKILNLYDISVFEDFEDEYGFYAKDIETPGENYTFSLSIAWERIISDYQGIVVPVILPKLYNMDIWYDIWCCTSGCIWDLQAVEKAYKLV